MDISDYLRFIVALIFVLALIGGLAVLARRFGLGNFAVATGKQRRLSLVESMALDNKRRVVLIRRDNVEYVVILGPNSEAVVETGIPAPPSPPPERSLGPSLRPAAEKPPVSGESER